MTLGNIFVYENNWKWNYINSEGKYISSVNFDDADDFVNNIARVRIGDDVYYIDTEGNKIEK